MSMPILREIGKIWKNELDQVSSIAFSDAIEPRI